MRNRFPGTCYRCGEHVEAGAGHFERFRNGWRTQHATCAIECRGTPDPERERDNAKRLAFLATQTGRKAQRARKALRDKEASA
jgi:hypothetical protein